MPAFFIDNWRLLVLLAGGSLLVSAWCLYADPIVNNDGIRYFEAAGHYAEGRWDQGLATYKWPFYPWLIGMLSQVAGIRVSWAAHIVNAGLVIALVVGFVTVVHQLGGDRRTLVFAALVILLFPAINKYRSFVIRDFGYLAAYLWSLAFVLRYWQRRSWASLAAWFGCAVTATAFRIEGLAFLVLPPLLIMWQAQRRHSAARRIWAGAIVVAGGALFLGFGIWLASSESGLPPRALLQAPLSAVALGWQAVAVELARKLQVLGDEFGLGLGSPGLWLVYVVTVALMIVTAVVKQIGLVFGALAVHGLWRRPFPHRELTVLWWAFVAINLFVLCEFAFSKLFLPRRYTTALVLTLLTAAPFGLARLYRAWRERGSKWFPVVAVLCLLAGVRGLDVFSHKEHLRAAGLWLRGHSHPDVSLFSNNQILIYFSGKQGFRPGAAYDWREVEDVLWTGRWKEYDYLALTVNRHFPKREQQLIRKLGMQPVASFANDKGDRVVIFDTRAVRRQ